MVTTVQKINSSEDLATFVECYDSAYGSSILALEYLQGCEDVFLFRDSDGKPVAGYAINTQLPYRLLERLPVELATKLRDSASGHQTYELGTIWVDPERRNGREKLELWLHIFGNALSRAGNVMVGNTVSEELYLFYTRFGMKLAYYGPQNYGNAGDVHGWIIYLDDVSTSKIPAMYEALKKRLA